ncbi:MAG TPA: hypothetical protein VGY98_08355 [Verrucomicrobiae bacterium]|nr:hypothetical protein [Verrucomicrobiae bacterium]
MTRTNDNWPGLAVDAGATGKGWDELFTWQHGMLQPCRQQRETACFAQAIDSVRAGSRGAPASTKLQTMAKINFTFKRLTRFRLFD